MICWDAMYVHSKSIRQIAGPTFNVRNGLGRHVDFCFVFVQLKTTNAVFFDELNLKCDVVLLFDR